MCLCLSFSADVERHNCAAPLCAENEKEKAANRKQSYLFDIAVYYLYVALSFSLYRRVGQTALCRLSLWADRGKGTAGCYFGRSGKDKRYFSSLFAVSTLFSFRREVPARGT